MGEIMAGFMDSSVFKDPLFGSPSNSASESLTPVNTPARAFNKSPAPTGYMSAEKAKEIAIAACRSQTEERAQHEEVQERAADLERQRLVAVQELVECQDSCQSWQLVSLAMGSIAAILAFKTIQRL